MTRTALLLAALALPALGAGCGTDTPEELAAGSQAPTWTLSGAGGAFSLADAAGRPVVLQFAPADPAEWEALAAAHDDLSASGALVIGAVTAGSASALRLPFALVDDPDGTVADLYGYRGQSLSVVIDSESRLRARAEAVETGDALFALAGPALLEADVFDLPATIASTDGPEALDASDVDDLVRRGAALLDLRPADEVEAQGLIPYALRCPPEEFGPEALPANLAVPVVLAGPSAAQAAEQAIEWGFAAVYHVDDASTLADADLPVMEDEPAPPPSEPQPRPTRRAIG